MVPEIPGPRDPVSVYMMDSKKNFFLNDTLENMTKTWPSKTLRVVILSYEIHVVELQAYVRVQGYGHSVKFFSFDCSQHMIDRFRNFYILLTYFVKLTKATRTDRLW